MKTCPACHTTYRTDYLICPQDGTRLVEVGVWPDGLVIRGKYKILNKVGQGGMGSVYRALHLAFDEERAIKVISAELMSDELFVKRFKYEAVITRKLQHPNAVRVDDIDEAEDGRPFIVMEYIQGQSLKKLIKEKGALPAERVCVIIRQVAEALEAAHKLGMIHRDIKPDNIVLIDAPRGEIAKVLDFGIAKLKEARMGGEAKLTLTGAGVLVGTPQYMSPEQAMGKRGDELDGRSDLYSLGVVMYHMLSGKLPFKADTTMAAILAHVQKPAVDIREMRPDLQIPVPIANLVMKTLEKDPNLRPPTARALIEEIDRATKLISATSSSAASTPPAGTAGRRETVVMGSRAAEKSEDSVVRIVLAQILPNGSVGEKYILDRPGMIAGRLRGDIYLPDDPLIAPEHARFTQLGEAAFVEDMGSPQGIFLRLRKPHQLKDGDIVLAGRQKFRFDTAGPRLTRLDREDQDAGEYPLQEDITVIGHTEGTYKFPADDYMSGTHARLTKREGTVFLEDQKSTNGTFVRIRKRLLASVGETLLIGSQTLRITKEEE
ncbi:MAG TPA: FHA domain-containing serine/threonine-protein kinase [Terriglobia bacterium]|nr:FHA domain-containing serine/threonine-protein kinase [Terriglobia bacterium]